MDLIFDVKHLIASLNPEAWYWMVQLDDEFKAYASSKEGIAEYKKIHTQIKINKNFKKYNLFGKRHREDGPAIIWSNGEEEWYINDKRHREDGPALISNGSEWWFINGKLHREDGPANIWPNGTREWWINGKRHREDGPAVICTDGEEEWYINGNRHQDVSQHDLIGPEGGPAIIWSDGSQEWYINEEQI